MALENTWLGSRIETLPNGRQVLKMGKSANFIIVTADNFLIMAKQFRPAEGKVVINCFGGWCDNDESYEETTLREMFEEANIPRHYVNNLVDVHRDLAVSLGYTDEENTTFIVKLNKSLNELDLKCNDEDENIEFEILDLITQKARVEYLRDKAKGMKFKYTLDKLLHMLNK